MSCNTLSGWVTFRQIKRPPDMRIRLMGTGNYSQVSDASILIEYLLTFQLLIKTGHLMFTDNRLSFLLGLSIINNETCCNWVKHRQNRKNRVIGQKVIDNEYRTKRVEIRGRLNKKLLN